MYSREIQKKKSGFYMSRIEAELSKILDIAKMCDKEGFCKLCLREVSDIELRYSLNWDIQTGEEFVKASALVHLIDEWAEFAEGQDGYVVYGVEDGPLGRVYMIDVSCVWL